MHNIQDNLQHEDLTTLEIAGVSAARAESQVPRHGLRGHAYHGHIDKIEREAVPRARA